MLSATSSVNDVRTWTLGTFDRRNELGPSNSDGCVSTFMRRFLSKECRFEMSKRNHESNISQMDARLFQLEESVKHLESELISGQREGVSKNSGDALQKMREGMNVSAESMQPAEMTFGVREEPPLDSASVASPASDRNATTQLTQDSGADTSTTGALQYALVAERSNNDELECMIRRLEEDLRASSEGIVISSTKGYFDKSPKNVELRRILLHSREAEQLQRVDNAAESRDNQLVHSRGNNVNNLQRSLALVQQKREELQSMIAQLDTDIQVEKAEAASPKPPEDAQDGYRFATYPESAKSARVVNALQRMFTDEQQRRMDLERKVKRLESLLTVNKTLPNISDAGIAGRENLGTISLTSAAASSDKPRVVDDLQRKFTLEQQKRQEAEIRAKRLERELAAVTSCNNASANDNDDEAQRATVNTREGKLKELQEIKDKLEAELAEVLHGDEIYSAKSLERAMARERGKQGEVERQKVKRLASDESERGAALLNTDYFVELADKEDKERKLELMVEKLERDIATCRAAISAQKKQSAGTYDAMKCEEKVQKNQQSPKKNFTRAARVEKRYLGVADGSRALSSVPSTKSSLSRVGSGQFFDNYDKKSLLEKYGLGECRSNALTKSASTPRLVLPDKSPNAKQVKEPDKWSGMAIRPEFWLQEHDIKFPATMAPSAAAHSAHKSSTKQTHEEAARPPMSTAPKEFQAESDPFNARRQAGRRFQSIGQMFLETAMRPEAEES